LDLTSLRVVRTQLSEETEFDSHKPRN
jgi:hypothetical protein